MSETIINPISWPNKVISLSLPENKAYYIGDSVVEVKGNTEDGCVNLYKGITLGLKVTPCCFKEAGPQAVHVEYNNGLDAEVLVLDTTVTVVNAEPVELQIIKGADKVEYFEGDTFNKAGAIFLVKYNTGAEKSIPDALVAVDLEDPLELTDTEVTYSYTENEVTVDVTENITVTKIVATSIDVEGPTKIDYFAGDALDLGGLVVTAHYNNPDMDGIVADYITSPEDGAILDVDDNVLTVSYSYGGVTVTKDINLNIAIRPVAIDLAALGFGHLDGTTVVVDEEEGATIEDGVFSIEVANMTEEHPYAFIKASVTEPVGHNIKQYHWGLYENAEATEDIWEGIFYGDTLEKCGNTIGLENPEVVNGREIRMWVEEDDVEDVVAKVTLQRIEPPVEE